MKETKSFKKLLNVYLKVVYSNDFKDEIKRFRKKYNIPENGHVFRDRSLLEVTQGEGVGWLAEKQGYNPGFQEKDEAIQLKMYETYYSFTGMVQGEILSTLFKYGIYDLWIAEFFEVFFFVDGITKKDIVKMFEESKTNADLCLFSSKDKIYEMHSYYLKRNEYANSEATYFNNRFVLNKAQYPIVLEISDYTSKNDVLDFVRKNWQQVEKMRGNIEYKDRKLVNSRSRITWDVYDYIWKHKDVKPRSKLAEMVNKKFRTKRDAIYIRNIISKLKKERNS